MSYTNATDVRRRAGFTGNVSITTASITSAIEIADAVINSSLYGIYSLPLSETPRLVEEISAHLAVGALLIDNYGEQDITQKVNGQNHIDYAQGLLTRVKERDIKLLNSVSAEMTTVTTNEPSFYPDDASYNDADDPTASITWMTENF
jgi:phage gp36-like protein